MTLISSAGTRMLKKTKIKYGANFQKYNGLLLNKAETPAKTITQVLTLIERTYQT